MGPDRHTPIELEQDCEATLIPGGQKVTLRRGERVVVTQALGGSFTVLTLAAESISANLAVNRGSRS